MSDRYDTIETAKEELREWAGDNDDRYPDKAISDSVDAATPVYDADILEWAADCPDFAREVVDAIRSKIADHIANQLWAEWAVIEEEREEALEMLEEDGE